MKIIVAGLAGFCFGVERAVSCVNSLLDENSGKRIYTLGKLIHNPVINQEFESRGVKVISPGELEGIFESTGKDTPTVVVARAHGITREINEKLEKYAGSNGCFSYIDCTCPKVKKIHSIMSENACAGTTALIFGDKTHPEVEGIRSWADGEVIVFGSPEELFSLDIAEKQVILVSQTTQKLTDWKQCQKYVQKVCTNPLIFDTICNVTENRQNEVARLAEKADAMIIIGGRDSSNTNKLYEIAKGSCENTFFVEKTSDLPLDSLSGDITIGIAAGASTPGSIIQEVKNTMSENEARETENFAGMLEDSLKTLNTGDTVTGTVTHVTSGEVQVDLGTKVTGIIPLSEINDNGVPLEELYHVGDTVEAIAVRVSDLDGVATLSRRKIEGAISWRKIKEAVDSGEILEGTVKEAVKSGVIISIEGQRVFVPASHTGLPREADLSQLVGTAQKVKIIDVDDRRHRAVASIRLVASAERKEKAETFWSTIEEGMEFDGVVKSLTSYGAFVDLGGVDGMVHSSELSWRHIKHPSEVVSIGETLHVFVKSVDKEAKRISLGYKTPESDPWIIFTNKYGVDDVVSVRIVSLLPFGAFAEILPGVDGLIHISQIANRKIDHPSSVLQKNQVVDAKIVGIDNENRKISLSIRALLEPEEDSYVEDESADEATDEAIDEAVASPDDETAE